MHIIVYTPTPIKPIWYQSNAHMRVPISG